MTVVLLVLIALILLFGAATVRGVLGALGAYVLIVLIGFFVVVGLKALMGDSGLYWALGLLFCALLVITIWKSSLSEDRVEPMSKRVKVFDNSYTSPKTADEQKADGIARDRARKRRARQLAKKGIRRVS